MILRENVPLGGACIVKKGQRGREEGRSRGTTGIRGIFVHRTRLGRRRAMGKKTVQNCKVTTGGKKKPAAKKQKDLNTTEGVRRKKKRGKDGRAHPSAASRPSCYERGLIQRREEKTEKVLQGGTKIKRPPNDVELFLRRGNTSEDNTKTSYNKNFPKRKEIPTKSGTIIKKKESVRCGGQFCRGIIGGWSSDCRGENKQERIPQRLGWR